MGPDVGEQIVDDLAQPAGVALHDQRLRSLELEPPVRLDGARGLDGLADELGEVDLLAFERAALIEAREQEQVVDEHRHPGCFALDPGHRAGEIVGAVARSAAEELGVGRHGGERRAQLVGRVGDEAPQPRLRRGTLREGALDVSEHRVQRRAEPTDLGALVRPLDAAAEVAGGDRARSLLDAGERPEPEAHEPEAEADDRCDDAERDE